jgi:hypothetical protein
MLEGAQRSLGNPSSAKDLVELEDGDDDCGAAGGERDDRGGEQQLWP